ncbi:hypothetical protein SXBG_00051 [Synechococcus phage S-CAM1]|jgi:gamma-glutamyl phosphate reductase|uniref:Uncharacterized protein n=1 Tax=Synechococcus phage S-CAM1 TaxID=754037 RepID=M4QF06_9CAUD|nr:hypothetical protein SXBG_00051 [Synechococcus phage S-CAM1]AGH26788.1 hypothetical protein SXBG_00051 [Synechococcus phage S-CAM1]AOV57297.1 hypothetical protein N330309_042 [Synechococcus phage S-CAM1]AOV57547.1 hypothetical protein N170310_042 [Synechococcus phage S-CAM1]AOV57797.1 hypothetical protein C030809_042 [Synechococcus phage S-CAM1]AOV58047.1 hypothetical protein S170810_042 [Synechococcus phage S-CAM1]
MALSKSVEESIDEASASLRNALAFAARQERPMVCNAISEIIVKLESLKDIDSLMDKLENRQPGDRGTWGPMFE